MIKTHVLNLGAGVQSSTLALMAEHGEVVVDGDVWRPEIAIFSDTKAEPQSVYTWLDWLETQLSFPVFRVSHGDLAADGLEVRRSGRSGKIYHRTLIPNFTVNKVSGSKGMLPRKCTGDYKINPITKFVREYVNLKSHRKYTRSPKDPVTGKFQVDISYPEFQVIRWLGISTDEASRMKDSGEAWSLNVYPLIEMGMSRDDCMAWMESKGYPRPPRSACVFCPYHSDAEWSRLKREEPSEFQRAVDWEKQNQAASTLCEVSNGVPFLHTSCKPLDQVEFKQFDPKEGFQNECEGMCGV